MKRERGGYLWAPQKSKDGRALSQYKRLLNVNIGDMVFCYSKKEIKSIGIVTKAAIDAKKPLELKKSDWKNLGYMVELDYHDLSTPIYFDEILTKWRLRKFGPFDKNGDVIEGYFFDVSSKFARFLFNQFYERIPSVIRTKFHEYKTGTEVVKIADEKSTYFSSKELIEHISKYIQSKGFYYQKEDIINLYLSLRSKPFVIIAGVSGTGKTKIVQWLAESVGGTEKNGQFTIIPVRSYWSDSSDLLGYVDIKGEYIEGPFVKVVKNAINNPDKPYFILFDEMNIARVEYYFSDMLSIMESRRWENGDIVSINIITKDIAGYDLSLPNNLYIFGTVNMDETTYPFSKKVLDRAFTIEFNQIKLDHFSFLNDLPKIEAIPVQNDLFKLEYLHLKDVYEANNDIVHKVTDELVKINEVLKEIYAQIGYRVRDEICFYLANNAKADLFSFEKAFDYCILQKILPRISGSDARVDRVLRELYKIFSNKEIGSLEDLNDDDFSFAKYPKSARKVVEMLRRLDEDGFTSFWISS